MTFRASKKSLVPGYQTKISLRRHILPPFLGIFTIVSILAIFNMPWTPGVYKFVFTLLDKLQAGDEIIVDYNGTRYIYRINSTEVVSPDNINVLKPTDPKKHSLELITCTPVGTSKNRLVVHAEQISPNYR
jgi:hypothetical protein